MSTTNPRCARLPAPLAALLALGCTDSQTETPPAGSTNILITDTPFPYDVVAQANIYVVKVEAGTDSGSTGGGTPIPHASIRAMVGDSSMPENTWFVAGTGTTDTTGHFRISYLSPSTRWVPAGWVYNLALDGPASSAFQPVIIRGVTVVAPTESALGEIVLP